ncbi:MAG: saccharopine dehydrogenase family protein [Gemmatimonadaceae bacterium]
MILIYGANGYTGRLLVDECARRGLAPLIAARRADTLAPLTARHGFEARVASLDDPTALRAILDNVILVLHAAGPFFRTSEPMVNACLDRGVHYLDITGEIAVFERVKQRHDDAVARGVVLLPGVGFDVVPTDCVAAQLARRMPGATSLDLAFAGGGGVSRGTLKTMFLGAGRGGAIRKDGRITPVPLGWDRMTVPFHDRPREVVTIPWGDISTAYTSTGIPNIRTYTAMSRGAVRTARTVGRMHALFSRRPVQRLVESLIDRTVEGPDAEQRASRRMQVWGRVTAAQGTTLTAVATTPEGYQLTAIAAIEAATRVLANSPTPGYHTPATAFGAHFLDSLPGCVVVLPPSSTPSAPESNASGSHHEPRFA